MTWRSLEMNGEPGSQAVVGVDKSKKAQTLNFVSRNHGRNWLWLLRLSLQTHLDSYRPSFCDPEDDDSRVEATRLMRIALIRGHPALSLPAPPVVTGTPFVLTGSRRRRRRRRRLPHSLLESLIMHMYISADVDRWMNVQEGHNNRKIVTAPLALPSDIGGRGERDLAVRSSSFSLPYAVFHHCCCCWAP